MKVKLALVVLLVAAAVLPAQAAWEYTFHRSGMPTDRLEFKIEAHPAVVTGFRKRDDLPRGYHRYLTASGVREEGILCEVPPILNHRSVNFAGVKQAGDAYAVTIGFTAGGSRDCARMCRDYMGRRVAVVVNHHLVATFKIDGVNDSGMVMLQGGWPCEVAEAMVRVLYSQETNPRSRP